MKLRAAAAALLVSASGFAVPFRVERTVVPAARGANRLDADATLIGGAAPGLRDLRLLDASGREVPYLLVAPRSSEEQWIGGPAVPVAPTKTTTAFETDLGAIRLVDRFRVDGLAPPFLKHARLEGSGDRARWNLLADTTVFDLPDQSLVRRDVGFTPGEYRYLRLTWDDRNSARVTGAVQGEARLHSAGSPAEPVRADLLFRPVASDPRFSRYRIALPAANLPITAIEVRVAPGDVFRTAVVSRPTLQGHEIAQVEIGTATLRRASRDGVVAEDLSIPVGQPGGNELTLAIETGGKPALQVTGVRAVYAPQPWIYFESADGTPLTARYGDSSAEAPQYDLEAARRFVARSRPASARWSGSATAAAIPPQVPPPIPTRGAGIDRSAFRFARPLPAGPPGMVIVPLDAHVLAFSRAAADVRIVDAENRQIPFIVEHRQEPLAIDLKVPPRGGSGRISKYRLELPYTSLPDLSTLVLTTNATVFERRVKVTGVASDERDSAPRAIADDTWRNTDPDTPAAPFATGAPVSGLRYLDVEIDEGDNAPLSLASARLLLPGIALRFRHPGVPLSLIYGNANAESPRYDLALLAAQLFTVPANEISAGGVTAAQAAPSSERRYFWIAIAAAVLVLLALLSRLLVPNGGEETRPLG